MTYEVIRKDIKTGNTYKNEVTQEQLNNITQYPSSLYTLESIKPVEEKTEEIKRNDNHLTEQQKAVKQLIKDLKLKYDTVINITTNIYISKNRKIKNIQDALYYALQYKIVEIGDYTKIGDYLSVFRNGIQGIEYNKNTGRIKIEMYKQD
jgi:hypothetical protein